ncbi:tumor necrosis factor receptor superfamily member hypothetical protein [Limosa lapponica baueri]|uniref:Uncharacterized protein n=1 Tax=Limosa lapponica baueri TaxID=1758121 RepID=A0A2I0TIU7_LIMLA|nr:tumor necrosis factor receptor superfamily member hypothetical protein [Limosa lapponica baueri]
MPPHRRPGPRTWSCEEKGLVVKVKGTNTSDVICGKCPVPRAGLVQSRDLLVPRVLQHSEELAWPLGVLGRGVPHYWHDAFLLLSVPMRDPESSKRSSLSVLIPITAAVVTCLVGVCIYCLVHSGKWLGHEK